MEGEPLIGALLLPIALCSAHYSSSGLTSIQCGEDNRPAKGRKQP